MKFDRRGFRNVVLILSCAAVVVVLFHVCGLRVNFTPSHVPVGLWRALPADSISVGDVVSYDIYDLYFAEPQVYEERMRFFHSRLIKKVAALPGSVVELSGDVVVIDGTEFSKAQIADDSWRKVDYPLVVPEGAVWIMADVTNAYDSRYHGPLPISMIREKCEPVVVWE
jgi:type IV secretory pathway protease TraF